MAAPNDVAQPQHPPSPVADPDRTRALLRELSASMGVAPDSEEGLAALQAFIRSSSTSARSTTPPPLQAPTTHAVTPSDAPMEDAAPPLTERPTVDIVPQSAATSPVPASEGATVPLASIDVAMDEAPAPSSEGGAPTHLPNITDLYPQPSPLHPPWLALNPLEAPCPSTLNRSSPRLLPRPLLLLPPPLLDPRAGSRLDTEMEWRMFPPNCRLQYVPRDSEVGGSTVYPPVPCSGCIEARHSVCSHYDTFEGRARAKALITGRKLVGGQPSTDASIKSEPGPSRVTWPRKRVRLLPPSSSSSPIPDDSPHPSTSRASSTPDDSALATAFAIRDAVVAAVEAFDQTLEEHRLSSKAKGKRRKRD
ncbi:hypothetical protein EDD15DRAFT_2367958 [Pisolithus albus]|nr:hypothetical protein EDD15DRAFT_2367958 [Pisolithus albus]